MDETQATDIALSALGDLKELKLDVHDIKQIILEADTAEVDVSSVPEVGVEPSDVVPNEDYTALTLADDSGQPRDPDADHMALEWSQSALLVAILCVLLVQLGVNLWQCFSDKWRS